MESLNFSHNCGRNAGPSTPRADPYVQISRIRLLPRVSGVKPRLRVRMHDLWFGNPSLGQRPETCPGHAVTLAPSPYSSEPMPLDLGLEALQIPHIPWHTVIIVMPLDHPLEPGSLLGDRGMTPTHQGRFDGLQVLTHPLFDLSLSRLNHWLPRGQAHPEVVQGTAEFYHQITDPLLPQADPVLHDAAALDTTVDRLDPQPTLVQRLVRLLLLQGQLLTTWLLHWHKDLHLGERERQEAEILQQLTSGWEWGGGGLSDAQIMDTAAVGVAQKEDDEQGIDEQDIFHGVIFFR
jgi:hypothetical protein